MQNKQFSGSPVWLMWLSTSSPLSAQCAHQSVTPANHQLTSAIFKLPVLTLTARLCSATCKSFQQLFPTCLPITNPACFWPPFKACSRSTCLLSPTINYWNCLFFLDCLSWTYLPHSSPSNLMGFHLRLRDCRSLSTFCAVNKTVLFHSTVLRLVPTPDSDSKGILERGMENEIKCTFCQGTSGPRWSGHDDPVWYPDSPGPCAHPLDP